MLSSDNSMISLLWQSYLLGCPPPRWSDRPRRRPQIGKSLLDTIDNLEVGCLHPVACILGQVQGFRLTQHWFQYFIQ
jgi:hypothetical protein